MQSAAAVLYRYHRSADTSLKQVRCIALAHPSAARSMGRGNIKATASRKKSIALPILLRNSTKRFFGI